VIAAETLDEIAPQRSAAPKIEDFMFLAPDKGKGTERERSFTTDCGMYWEGNPKIRSELSKPTPQNGSVN
jgi:hypothetical protein